MNHDIWNGPDWACPICGYVNMAIRERCRNFIACGWDSAIVSEGVMCVPANPQSANQAGTASIALRDLGVD